LRAFFRALWRGLDGLRKVLHLLLLLILFGLVVGALRTSLPTLPTEAALVIRPEGAIVEQLSGDPLRRAIESYRGGDRSETLIWDLTDAIDAARDDDRVRALVLDLDTFAGAGQPTLEEVARSIDAFRESGKKVVAHATVYLQDAYYLASHADEIYVDPLGFVLIDGYERFVLFYRQALDKLGIDINVFRVGAYKSAVEPFTRNDMSPEDREETTAYLESLWATYQSAVTKARNFEEGAVSRYVAGIADEVAAQRGDGAQVAVDAKLVTGVRSRPEVEQRLVELVGEDADDETYRNVSLQEYLRVVRAERALKTGTKPVVAVVVASGELLDGWQPAGIIGGDSTAELIRDARRDGNVKALVLRVDSPGGSMYAAEALHREIEAFKATGRPVVASMADVAASGGYYISAPADEIFASPATITGSIGVFAPVPNVSRALEKIGVSVDGVGTTPLSGQLRLDRPLGPDVSRFLQATVEHSYEVFLERVAVGRGKTRDEVDAVAQGRVWSGTDAQRVGLVDTLGGFDAAIESAAKRAELEPGSYAIEFIEPQLTWAEQLALNLEVTAARWVSVRTGAAPFSGLAQRLDPIALEVERWSRLMDSGTSALAYCFCVPP